MDAFYYPVLQIVDPLFFILYLVLIPSNVFLIAVIAYSTLAFLIFNLFVKVSLSTSTLHSSSVSIFLTIALNSFLGKLLMYISFSSFFLTVCLFFHL